MKLYLVRHGHAVSPDLDPKRPLSPKGRDVVLRMAKHLRGLGLRVSQIQHSTKVRAEQTAQIISSQLVGSPQLRSVDGLAPNEPVEPLAHKMELLKDDLMLVGHLPFLPTLVAFLLADRSAKESFSFPEAGVVVLSRDEKGIWSLEQNIWPENLVVQSR